MTTQYEIKCNGIKIFDEKFNSIENAEQNLLNNGYHLIENNIHQKIWATLNFDTNKFNIENIEIIEIKEFTSQEITKDLLDVLLHQDSDCKFFDASGCQNFITLKINNQKFRIIVEEIEK